MNPKKRNASHAIVNSEYLKLLKEYEKSEKKRRKENPKAETPQLTEPNQTNTTQQQSEPLTDEIELPPVTDYTNESDVDSDEFEDIDIDNEPKQDIQVSITGPQARRLTKSRANRPKSDPKYHRLLIHKISLMVWILHAYTRNQWLYSPVLLESKILKGCLPEEIKSQLRPPSHLTPFLKSKKLIEGLRALSAYWRKMFKVHEFSLSSTKPPKSRGDQVELGRYEDKILNFQGSADLLGQGFVALLRSLDFRVRLCCSLQPPDNLTGNYYPKPNKTSNYPIFWAEVWDEGAEGWISVDPLTNTVRLPTKTRVKTGIEPPASDSINTLRYCLAFEDNYARDVTRRYAYQYNARTRKKRLAHFEKEDFLNKLLIHFCKRKLTKEDANEMKELAKYPLLEGIPTSVQDFVGHPRYALKSQMHKNEVLKPDSQPCGTLSTKSHGLIYIYNRSDILTARSSQSWYRRGRTIKLGAQPRTKTSLKNKLTGETHDVGLYTYDQTEEYIPPPVESDGTVPKSQYKTVDVFNPKMVPAGGVYIKHELGSRAAKILRIDYANVVTGVEFGRGGPKSKMLGVMVAKQFAEACYAVINGLLEIEKEQEAAAERLRTMLLWKKLIIGIQIWNRVESMNPDFQGENNNDDDDDDDNVSQNEEKDLESEGVQSDDSFNDIDVEEISL